MSGSTENPESNYGRYEQNISSSSPFVLRSNTDPALTMLVLHLSEIDTENNLWVVDNEGGVSSGTFGNFADSITMIEGRLTILNARKVEMPYDVPTTGGIAIRFPDRAWSSFYPDDTTLVLFGIHNQQRTAFSQAIAFEKTGARLSLNIRGKKIELVDDVPYTVGRSDDNDIQAGHSSGTPDETVSRVAHLVLIKHGNKVYTYSRSPNGTYFLKQ